MPVDGSINSIRKARSPQSIANLEFDDNNLSKRTYETGFVPKTISAVSVNTAILVGRHSDVRITNASGGTIYVLVGDAAVALPAGMADGIAILDKASIVINTGTDSYIRFSAITATAQYIVYKTDTIVED